MAVETMGEVEGGGGVLPGFFYRHHPSQDNTYQSLCYTSREALAGTKISSMGPP